MSEHKHNEHVEHGHTEAQVAPAEAPEKVETKDVALETARHAYKAALEVFKGARQSVIDTRTAFKAENQRVKAERAASKEKVAA